MAVEINVCDAILLSTTTQEIWPRVIDTAFLHLSFLIC